MMKVPHASDQRRDVPGNFVEAIISPVVCGVVRLWSASGSVLLTVREPAELAAVLGRARVPRRQVGEGNTYRELVTVNPEAGLLGVTGRFGTDGEVDVRLFEVGPAASRPGGDPWQDIAAWLSAVVPAAAARGEYVALETGGTAYVPVPHVTFSVAAHDDERVILLEADPAPPSTLPLWDAAARVETGARLAVPASRRSLDAVPALLTAAAAAWANPWRLCASFGTQPAGPFLLGP